MKLDDTIAAIATPIGEGGLGVIRLSGQNSLEIIQKAFTPKSKLKSDSLKSHRLYFGKLKDKTGTIDEVCVVYMKAPRSYTKENSAEVSCHGSPAVLRRALKCLITNGARMAEPGEFTKRAFLNGRIDLSQAEGVIDLIKARSEGAADAAFKLMEGGLSSRINVVKEKLVHTLAQLEASIDFPDEEFQTETDEQLIKHLDKATDRMNSLLRSYESGKFLKHGMGLAIIGKPNVGKSSLLNALIEEERSIVTGHPGTTRDLIRAETELAGLPVELIDTAGLHCSPEEVEAIGIERALKAAKSADAVIALFDASREWDEADEQVLETLKKAKIPIAVINKTDMTHKLNWPDASIIPLPLSVKERVGIDGLLESIKTVVSDAGNISQEEPVVTRTRHLEIFKRIASDIQRAKDEMAIGRELSAAGVWDALEEIKRFTGESYTDEILSKIFDEFCIGK